MLALPNAIGVESSRVALQEKIHHIQLNLISKSPSWCLESQVNATEYLVLRFQFGDYQVYSKYDFFPLDMVLNFVSVLLIKIE